MKRTLALIALTGVALTGCSSTDVPSKAASSSPAQSTPLASAEGEAIAAAAPDVKGMTVEMAAKAIDEAGLEWSLQPLIPDEYEDRGWEGNEAMTRGFVVDSQSLRAGDTPSESVVLIYASPTEAQISNLQPWTITCSDDSYSDDSIEDVHTDLKSIWASKNFEEYRSCDVEFTGTEWNPTKKEKRISKIVNEHFNGKEDPELAYADAMETCAIPGASDYDGSESWEDTPGPYLEAAVILCPDAPFYKQMKKWADGEIFEYGTYEVGTEIKPGTYRSRKKVSDCYWARLTPGGDIIANNFISYAASGATVTVRSGEVLEVDEDCGTWTKQ
ncbi:PASTA domain-containing protein [Paeniglutamicibacter sp. R2-26]|uniref:PASTA domain-containing protein n=1 Tax=Paeniglutamicibacter sp. R2-26 TaxID=3144417 RepID=UPI003EE8002C